MDFADRYKTPLSELFTRQYKLQLEHRVELALLKALSQLQIIPAAAYPAIKQHIDAGRVTVERTLDIERETHHDIMAMVKAISEQDEQYGGFVHYGATSQDINDTVTALQIQHAQQLLLAATDAVKAQLGSLAERYKLLTAIGRTHGQHAIPITMGFKFANFLYELSHAQSTLQRVNVPGKFSGAVGTFASLGTDRVCQLVMEELGLQAVPISTQVVSRLHIADFIYACSSIAAVLERLGKEIRNLQRTEINETAEGFGAGQVGSSTMPQKRNPHKSERVCGLAREIRSALQPSLETVSVEHERDLTNSSVERITIPRAAILTHYILLEMETILSLLVVDTESVERNLRLLGGKQLSERIMIACAHKLGRQTAHEILRQYAPRPDFVAALESDERIASAMSKDELQQLLNPHTYIGLAPQIVDTIVATYGVKHASTENGTSSGQLTYAQAGVNIDEGDSLVERIKPLAAATSRPGSVGSIGGFGGLFDLSALPRPYTNPLLVACTDGVGTKLAVAKLANSHATIGIDLVAMSVNDLIVQGAEPLFFLDYFATSQLEVAQAAEVIKGIADGCSASGCALVGGETAELPGMYQKGEYDLAGFAVGVVERTRVLPDTAAMRAGDVLLGLASDGVHSNGYSLVRRVVRDSGADWFAAAPYASNSSRLCDDLLRPTRLYVKPLLSVLSAADASQPVAIKGLAHITGGGLPGNVDRCLPSHLGARIDGSSWQLPAVFRWLRGGKGVRNGGSVEATEMLRTFNCGIGMVCVVGESEVAAVQAGLERAGEKVYVIGRVEQRSNETSAQVMIDNTETLFGPSGQ